MDKEQLRKGISILYDMELNNYLMTRTISQLYYEIEDLGIKQNFEEPTPNNRSYSGSDELSGGAGIGWLLGAILGGAGGCASGGFLSGIGGLFGGMIAGVIVGLIIGGIVYIVNSDAYDEKMEKQYIDKCRVYNEMVEKDNIRVEKELKKKAILIQERNRLTARRNEAKKKMNQFYDMMGIDEKYRNLVPVGYMNEFIHLQISTQLEGTEGLYYLVRKELRYDQFQCTLEEISRKLDEIIDKQTELYHAICDMNYRCAELVDSVNHSAELASRNSEKLESALQNAQLTAYNTERIARENEYQSFLMTWKY